MGPPGAVCRLFTAIAVAGLMTACTSGAPRPAPTADPVPTVPASGGPPPSPVYAHRACDSAVTIVGGADPRAGAAVVGPAAFVSLTYPFGTPGFDRVQPDGAGWRYVKAVLLLRTGTRATVSIPPTHREVGSLTYRGGHHHEVSFAACPPEPGAPPDTQFSGGFAVRRPVCLPVEVSADGTTHRAVLDIGAGGC